MHALLTRAADQEARRQSAAYQGDVMAMREHEAELRRLWARYVALDYQIESQQPMEARR
jgi:hypothetical protein